ncbi:MAG: hypothetical protein LBR16_04720 [Treponema sp.]|jgi:hypothetical protein|nr:hypothetical protein [Treponema sp.]
MKIRAIRGLVRKDTPIYYQMRYSGIAELELAGGGAPLCAEVDFTVETAPAGGKTVTITRVGAVDYPLVPLRKALAAFVRALDAEGGLPV